MQYDVASWCDEGKEREKLRRKDFSLSKDFWKKNGHVFYIDMKVNFLFLLYFLNPLLTYKTSAFTWFKWHSEILISSEMP